MSYRKKHNPPKAEKPMQKSVAVKEYKTSGVERIISTRILYSGQPYQRPVMEREVTRLMKKWNDRLFKPLVVSFRDGKYYVIDGQHRLAALRRMNEGEDVFVLCLVYDNLSYKEEAELCYQLDKSTRRLSSAQAITALIESGNDPEINDVRSLLMTSGYKWALDKQHGGDYEITATRTVIDAYRLLGRESFSRMLSLLDSTWHGSSDALAAKMLSGMALFLKTYDTELDDYSFALRLGAIDPLEIVRRANADFSTNRNALRYARVLLGKYNGGQRGGHKLPYRFNG